MSLALLGIATNIILGSLFAHWLHGAGPVPGPYIFKPVNDILLTAEDLPHGVHTFLPLQSQSKRRFPGHIPSVGTESFGGTIFRESTGVPDASRPPESLSMEEERASNAGLVHFDQGMVSIVTIDGPIFLSGLGASLEYTLPENDGSLSPFDIDLFAAQMDSGLPPFLYGEATDSEGIPERWSWREQDYPAKTIRLCTLDGDEALADMRRLVRSAGITLPGGYIGLKVKKYREMVNRYADKYGLATALMLAIMHTESSFNPLAVSSSQAVGLMQIVPHTAGNDVYRFLTGTKGTPSVQTLFTPEHNIKYGAIYLYLLNRQFSRIRNASSRQMCIIAAYNGGPGAVLRAFNADQEAAFARINLLSPEQVYRILTTEMPMETCRYVQVVLGRMRAYK